MKEEEREGERKDGYSGNYSETCKVTTITVLHTKPRV